MYGLANPLLLADFARYWDGLGSRSSRLYDLLNVGWVLGRKDVVLDWEKFEPAFDGDPDLNAYRNRRALPALSSFVMCGQPRDHEAAWAAIHEPGFDPAVTAVVEGAGASAGGSGTVNAVRSVPNGTVLEVSSDGPSLLLVSQVWYPGWEAWVDGQNRGRPLRVDYLFQGVEIEAGAHTVELRFSPSLWRTGWILAGLTAGILLAIALLSRRTG